MLDSFQEDSIQEQIVPRPPEQLLWYIKFCHSIHVTCHLVFVMMFVNAASPTNSPTSSAPTSSAPTSSPTEYIPARAPGEQPLKDNWFRKRDVARQKAFPQKYSWWRKQEKKKAGN